MEKKEISEATIREDKVSEFQYNIGEAIPEEKGRILLEKNGWIVRNALEQYYNYYMGTGKKAVVEERGDSEIPKNSKNLIFFSDTRAGKSTLVNVLTNKMIAAVGDKSFGKSTTLEYSSYQFSHLDQSYKAYDGPGFNDSELRISNKDIKNQITEIMLDNSQASDLHGLIFLQSCRTDSFQMKRYLEQAEQIFGPSIKKTVLVLLTKYKKAEEGLVQEAKKVCERIGLKCLEWESVDITVEEIEQQKIQLFKSISNLSPFQMKDFVEYRKKIVQQAFTLQEQAPDFKKQEIEEYKDTVQKVTLVNDTVNMSIPIDVTKLRGGPAGWIGLKKTVSSMVNVSIPNQRPVITDVEVTRQFQKKTQVKPPLHQFIEQARKATLCELLKPI